MNQMACIEQLYQQKKYDPLDFADVRLLVGGSDSLSYTDNLFRAANNEKGDIVNHFMPQVSLESNLQRHYWKLELQADNTLHRSQSENNYTDLSALGQGRYDVDADTRLFVNGGYVLDHTPIGAFVDEPSALDREPTPSHTVSARTALDYLPLTSPWHVNGGVEANFIDYENVSRIAGINVQDDRDRVEYGGDVQLGYRLAGNNELYLKTAHTWKDHDSNIDSSALATRDATQHRYWIGYRHDGQNMDPLSYDVAAGYLEQDYDAGRWPDVEGLDLYANASWKIDPVNLVRLRITRDVRDAYSTQRSAYLRTQGRVNYEYHYTDLVTFGTGYSYTNYDFETLPGAADREDHVNGLHLWTGYEFRKNFEANLFYTYNNRNSNDSSADYAENVIGIGLSYKH